MYGVIFLELRKYVNARLGEAAWDSLLQKSGLGGQVYLAVKEYPDAHALKLVETACALTGKSAGSVLEDFGEFIVPHLLQVYGSELEESWKTLDVIENTDVRPRQGDLQGPLLAFRREDRDHRVDLHARGRARVPNLRSARDLKRRRTR